MVPSPPSRPFRHKQPTVSPPATRTRMSFFNRIRIAVYVTVLVFTLICLSMAAHFQSVLEKSDLTAFVPASIFVCSLSLLLFVVLLGSSLFLRERNPIQTRWELISLGVASGTWLILGAILAASDAQSADVECFMSDSEVQLEEEIADFHTDQYQAMYRVLNAFSLLNAVVIGLAFFALLFLAWRRHRKGDTHMWYGPVTSCAWFANYEDAKQSKGKTSSSSILPIATAYTGQPVFTEKPERKASTRRENSGRDKDYRQYKSTRPTQDASHSYSTQPRAPAQVASPGRYVRQGSGNSSRSGPAGPDLESGGMLNPYSRTTRGAPRR